MYSKDPSTHEDTVKEVLRALRGAGLYANLEKFSFSTTSVEYLKKAWQALERNRTEALNIMEEEGVTAKVTAAIFSHGDAPEFDASEMNMWLEKTDGYGSLQEWFSEEMQG